MKYYHINHSLKMPDETVSFKYEGYAGDLCEKLDENFLFSNFTDVTLVSGDGKYFRAHKIVLSTASEFLRDVLHLQYPQEPMISFPSIKQENLKALLDYMYLGYASVSYQNAEAFTEFALDMKLSGLANTAILTPIENLMNNDTIHQTDTISDTVEFEEKQNTEKKMEVFDNTKIDSGRLSPKMYCKETKPIMKNIQEEFGRSKEKKDAIETFLVHSTGENSRKSGMLPMNKFIDLNRRNKSGRKILQCGLCDYKNVKFKLKEHIDFKHEGKSFTCDVCDYKAELKHSMIEHKATKHEGKRFRCGDDECNYIAITKQAIRHHKKVVHEGFRYSCDKCK